MVTIFLTDLELWSMGSGKGGEAFSRTIEKYVSEGADVFFVSDVESNKNLSIVDDNHNIFVKPSVFKSWVSVRKIGVAFKWLDHKITTRRMINVTEGLLKNNKGKDILLYAYEIFGVEACKKLSAKHELPFVTRFQGTTMVNYKYSWINRILRYPHYQALKTRSDLVIMTDDGTKGDRVLDLVNNDSERLFLKNGLELMEEEVFEKTQSIEKKIIRQNLGITDDETMFLTVSRLTGWKRVDRAIDGFSSFLAKGGRGTLVIVGDGDQRSALEDHAEELGVREKVLFVGAISHGDVYDFMVSADVFLSLYDLSNVGNPLLEAMTLGKCIVTLNVGDTMSVINGQNGILLEYDDLYKLGDILLNLSMDEKARMSYGKNAREYANDYFYTWEKRMNIEYNEVLKLFEKNI